MLSQKTHLAVGSEAEGSSDVTVSNGLQEVSVFVEDLDAGVVANGEAAVEQVDHVGGTAERKTTEIIQVSFLIPTTP